MGFTRSVSGVGSNEVQKRATGMRASFPRALQGLGAFALVAGLAGAADALITPVDALTTSFFGADGVGPDNLWNASGLSGSGAVEGQGHDANPLASTMWFAADQDGGLGGPTGFPPAVNTQAAVFDLGAPTALAGAWVWNFNQAGNLGRAVNQFEILVSPDANPLTATWSSVGTFALDPPCGCATEGAQFVRFDADATTRLVRFNFISAQSGNPSEFVGLSEVRFAAPSAAVVSDDFDDGNDAGWAHFTPAGAASYTFPTGGYRIQATATGSPLNPARAEAWHPETAPFGDFYASVDVVDFDPGKPQAFGLLARQNHAGPGTLDGYTLTLSTDGTFARVSV